MLLMTLAITFFSYFLSFPFFLFTFSLRPTDGLVAAAPALVTLADSAVVSPPSQVVQTVLGRVL